MQLRLWRQSAFARTFTIGIVLSLSIPYLVHSAPAPTSSPSQTKSTPPSTSTHTFTSMPVPTSTEVFVLPRSTTTAPSIPLPTTVEGALTVLAATFGGCPPPLVPNTRQLVTKACQGPCCLPCPASAVFYEPGQFDTLNDAISVIRVVSCTATMILAISYLILPGRRQHPHLIILCMFVTTALWEGMGIIWLFLRRSLTCHNDVEETTLENSTVCGVQGILLVYLVGMLFVQGITLIANLHSLIVYRSSRVQRQVSKMIGLSFILPLALVVVPAVKKEFEFTGYGSICFMASDLVNPYFFYPIGAMMAFGVLVHLATVLYMIKTYVTNNQDWSGASASNSLPSATSIPNQTSVSGSNSQLSKRQKGVQTARDISRLLKQQWRPGAFALCQLVIYLVYFAFYFVEIQKFDQIQATSEWFVQWTLCLGEQGVQNILQLAISSDATLTTSSLLEPQLFRQLSDKAQHSCAPMAENNVPQFWKLCLSDAAPAAFGICIFFIFGSKYELWQDWKRFLIDTVLPRKWSSRPNQVDTLNMVQTRSVGDDLDTRRTSKEDNEDGGNGRVISKERKGSVPSILPLTRMSTDNTTTSSHHDVSFYPRRWANRGAAANNNSGSGSRIDLMTCGASFVTEHDTDADDGYIPYHPPATQPPASVPDPAVIRTASSGSGFKRTVSFQQTPTIFGSKSTSPAPSPPSAYGGPTARRSKKNGHPSKEMEGPNDPIIFTSSMHDGQHHKQPGLYFYQDLESIPESIPAPPHGGATATSSHIPTSEAPSLDATQHSNFPPSPPTPTPSTNLANKRAQKEQLREQQETWARNVMDGTEPWPSWPSKSSAATTMAETGASADMIGMDLDPAVVVRGHRIRKQLSVILDQPPIITVPTDMMPSPIRTNQDAGISHRGRRLSTTSKQQEGLAVVVLGGDEEDDQEEQARIRRRNQLRPSPLSPTALAMDATGVLGDGPLSPKTPVSPRSPPPLPPFIPPRSRSRPSFSYK